MIEILTALGIFSMLTVVIMNVFLLSLRAQRQTALRQETLSNVRYVTETMVRKIRTSEINYNFDYDADGDLGINGYEQELFLRDQDGNDQLFYLQAGAVHWLVNGQESTLTDINQVKVVSLRFYIAPITNPFAEERCNDSLKPAPNGCLNNTIACTVNDDSGLTGFCLCDTNGEAQSLCATKNCSPDGLCLPFDAQPRVTVVLGLESEGIRQEDRKRIYVQTTASSRVYKR